MSRSKKDRRKRAGRGPSRGLPPGHSGRRGKTVRDRNGGQCPPYAGGPRGRSRGRPISAERIRRAAREFLSDAVYSKWPVIRFLGLLGMLIGVFYVFFPWFTQTGVFQRYLALIAESTGTILTYLGHSVDVSGRSVSSARFSLEVVLGCDGIEATALFAAAVLASPVSLRSRLLFMFGGTVVLLCINVLRIVTLFLVGVYFPRAMDTMHWDAWPAVLIVLVLLSWLIWARWAVRREGLFADVAV